MLSTAHVLGVVTCSGGQINQITSRSINPGIESMIETNDGLVDPSFAAVMFQRPMASFSTTAIARALGYAGISALSVSATPVELWFQQVAAGGTRLTGANSTKFGFARGILCPKSIDASNDSGAATIDYEMAAVSVDGTTSPLTMAIGQTMPSIVTDREYFTVGPLSVNGTAIPGIQSTKIDLGISVAVEGGDGHAYPTLSYIESRRVVCTFRTKTINILDTIGFFAAQGTTDSVFYLRKVAAGGTRVADATAQHIRFTVDEGMISVSDVGGEKAEAEIRIECTYDGTNDALAINTAAAIA